MKRKIAFVLLNLFLANFVVSAVEIKAQVSVQNIMEHVSSSVERLESMGGQILSVKVNPIKKGQTDTQSYSLTAENDYFIIAVGDQDRIQDIDLAVYDGNKQLAGRDVDESNTAVVKVRPTRTQSYTIVAQGYKMSAVDGFYAIIIGYTRNYRISAKSTQTYRFWLDSGSHEISVSGNGRTDLDLFIKDSGGNWVQYRNNYSDNEFAKFTVARSGYFTVMVQNLGDIYNDYALFVR